MNEVRMKEEKEKKKETYRPPLIPMKATLRLHRRK